MPEAGRFQYRLHRNWPCYLVLFYKRKGKHINVSIELLMVFDGEDNFMSELTDFTSKYIQNT